MAEERDEEVVMRRERLLALISAGLPGFEAVSALIAINWGGSHLPCIVEKH